MDCPPQGSLHGANGSEGPVTEGNESSNERSGHSTGARVFQNNLGQEEPRHGRQDGN